MSAVLGRVAELWRYPVKSMLGERLDRCLIEPGGLDGDRVFALYDAADGTFASAKGVRRFGRLFTYGARLRDDGAVEIRLPGGELVASDDPDCDARLSAAIERTVELVAHDVERSRWYSFDMPARRAREPDRRRSGRFVDSMDVHLLTAATLERLAGDATAEDVRRFRPNVLIEAAGDGYPEDAWVGRTVELGTARLEIVEACERCVMPTLPQDDLPHDPGVRRRLLARHDDTAGVLARVVVAGAVAVGDELRLGTER